MRAWLLEAMQNAPGPSISVDVKDIWLEDETLVSHERAELPDLKAGVEADVS